MYIYTYVMYEYRSRKGTKCQYLCMYKMLEERKGRAEKPPNDLSGSDGNDAYSTYLRRHVDNWPEQLEMEINKYINKIKNIFDAGRTMRSAPK